MLEKFPKLFEHEAPRSVISDDNLKKNVVISDGKQNIYDLVETMHRML